MVAVSIVGPDEGEIISIGPSRLRILENGSNTSHRLGMGEIHLPPNSPAPLQHRHAQHDEGFYILSGSVRFTVGQDTYDAGVGTWVLVPPGAPHSFENIGEDTAVILLTFTPDLYVQYFRDIRDMVASGQSMTPDTMPAIWKKYATELAT
jgi:quercetin dioxygenase-like cupin family protein